MIFKQVLWYLFCNTISVFFPGRDKLVRSSNISYRMGNHLLVVAMMDAIRPLLTYVRVREVIHLFLVLKNLAPPPPSQIRVAP